MRENDSHIRSVAKGLTWRLLASLATVVLVRLFTGQWKTAYLVGGVELVAKIVLYYGHERVWNVITWGRRSAVATVTAATQDEQG